MTESCIEIDRLARYIGDTLPAEQKDQVEKHLAACDDCRENFVIANRVVADDDVAEWDPIPEETAESLWMYFKENISTLWEWTRAYASELLRQPQFEWAGLTAVRGAEPPPMDYVHRIKNIGDFQTELFVEKKKENRLSIKVRAIHESHGAKHLRLTLKRKGGGGISRHLKGEYATFENRVFGVYRLTLTEYRLKKTWDYFFELNEAGLDEKTDLSETDTK